MLFNTNDVEEKMVEYFHKKFPFEWYKEYEVAFINTRGHFIDCPILQEEWNEYGIPSYHDQDDIYPYVSGELIKKTVNTLRKLHGDETEYEFETRWVNFGDFTMSIQAGETHYCYPKTLENISVWMEKINRNISNTRYAIRQVKKYLGKDLTNVFASFLPFVRHNWNSPITSFDITEM